ncbi:MAG: YXWGXW repeat-containing protein [Planctomycetota bacterium]|nr:YXWGXW repeat-containing protein [Planctomycetota bacterium]
MRTWRVALVAALLACVALAGCTPRTVVVRQYGSYPPPPPQPVYVPAPASVAPPPQPVYVPAPAPVAPPPPAAQVDVEVLTRGPMHEAFGEPIVYAAQTAMVISRPPPPPIQELPPDERPADPRIVWVPGYWAWDDDRADFLWVSGCWRFPPPGYSWVPGYWTQVANGYQWVPGFWLALPAQTIVYQAPPPANLEAGPPGPPPADTYIWVPGYWFWTGYQYVWQPGHFAIAQPNWAWIPAHYVYSPRGCIFVAGYWDYPIARRGILFAPAWFGRGVYLRPGFRYSPAVVIDMDVLVINLFARPQYCHYYFGDYYDVRYTSLGFHAWFEFREDHRWYDPIAAHETWRRRHDDPMWERRERERFEHLRQDAAARPPRTFAAQQAAVARLPKPERQAAQIAQPLSQMVAKPPAKMRFEQINDRERRQLEQQATDVHKYREARAKWETPPAAAKAGKPPALVAPPTTTGAPPPAAAVTPPRATVVPPAAKVGPPKVTVAPPKEVRQPAEIKPPPGVRRPETTGAPTVATPPVVTPPPVAAPPKEVRQPVLPPGGILKPETPPKEVRAPAAPAGPVAPPKEVKRPEEARQPVAPAGPAAPVKRPEEVRQPPAPEKVNIPKPPILSRPPVIREAPPPPRPEPPKAAAPVTPKVEQPAPVRGKDEKEDGKR